MVISIDYMERYEEWCTGAYYDEATNQELMSIRGDDSEIRDRFYKDLSFGTGGLRGVIGAGTNRMNIYTVVRATQGLANYILKKGGEDKGVAIAFDSRHMSPEFAEVTALCLNANGIKTYRFETLRPTPELSFAVRELGCVAGVVITASHNPPEYNGYKVYWEDGAQITAPLDQEIIDEVNAVTDYASIKTMDRDRAEATGLYNVIGEKIDNRYMEELEKLVLSPESIRKIAPELTIVYTPIHGTGNLPVRRILNNLGFTRVHVVPEQELPDSSFSTVTYPNPEDPKAYTLALKLAQEVDADIVLATDPDADRLGVYAKDTRNGVYMPFSGNMSGMLIAEYQLEVRREKGMLPVNGALVTTIVSSNMAKEVAKEYGVNIIETLTGFKYIGEQIKFFEQDKSYEYLFGFEESYGCLVGTHARDKDAIAAVMALCEATAYYKERGFTLWDQMLHIYEKYGYYNEDLKSITLKGADGAEKIKSILSDIRKNPPRKLGEFNVLAIRDYKKNETLELTTGEKFPTGLPKSDVLYFDLDKDSWCCVRPSGTEPKIKFYLGVKGDSLTESKRSMKVLSEALSELLN